jgi:cytochrome P450
MTQAQLRRVHELPGPRGLPIVGNLLQIDRDRLHLTAENWSRTYGDYFRFRIGPRWIFAVANPETIAAMLRDRPDGFHRSQRLGVIAGEFGFNGVFSANGDAWRRQRPMVMAGFDPGHIKTYFPALVKVTERFAGRWRRAAAAGEAIDLQGDLMRYTVDVTAGLAFGADINTLESDDDVIQKHLDKVLPALFRRLFSPFPPWFRWPKDRSLPGHLQALQRAVQDFIAQARARIAANPALRERPTNLIEAMIVARDNPASGLDDGDVAGNVLTMLLAGEDTTANTLAWMIYLLHRHPEVLARAREEVGGRIEKYEQAATLPFIEACINETMRLKPVAPILMLQSTRDTVVADIAVPARTLLMCLMRAGATDERRFPDAQTFDPARWLSGASASSPKRVAMPFGAGPRLCPGRYLALLEMKMVMAMLLAEFDIEAVSGDAREQLAFTMAPVGLKLKLRAR